MKIFKQLLEKIMPVTRAVIPSSPTPEERIARLEDWAILASAKMRHQDTKIAQQRALIEQYEQHGLTSLLLQAFSAKKPGVN